MTDHGQRQLPPGLWRLLWPYRWKILTGALIGLLIGAAIALARPKVYTASTTLLFPTADVGRLRLGGLGGGGESPSSVSLLGGMLTVPRPGATPKTAMLLLRSWPVQDAVAWECERSAAWQATKRPSVRKALQKALTMKDGDSGELRITFTDVSPAVAHAVTVALVRELEQRTKALGIDPAERSVGFLTQQLTDANTSLAAAQQQLQQFERQHGVVSLTDQQSALARQYTTLQDDVERTRIESTLVSRQASLLAANAQRLIKACVDPGVGSTLNARYQRVEQLESELALLSEKFTPESPEHTEATLNLQEAKRQLSAEIARQLTLVDSGSAPAVSAVIIEAALKNARLARLTEALAAVSTQIARYPRMKSTYMQLTLEVETQVARVKLLRAELERAQIAAQDRGPAFVVVEPARVPDVPQPRRLLFTALVLALLGALAVAAVPYYKWQQALGMPTSPEAEDKPADPVP